MTKREKLREDRVKYDELYKKTMRKLEDKKPVTVYQLAHDNGDPCGRLAYNTDKDYVTIDTCQGNANAPGSIIHSLYAALGDLLSGGGAMNARRPPPPYPRKGKKPIEVSLCMSEEEMKKFRDTVLDMAGRLYIGETVTIAIPKIY